ncbi:MAG: cupin domain-containing protein [Pseudomonadales bacterium]
MTDERVFGSSEYLRPSEGEPIRSVVTQTPHAVIVAWLVLPGQEIRPHVHPYGQDTWTILSGSGDYILDQRGNTRRVVAADVVIARANEVHGVQNNGEEPLVFISVVSPSEAGYELR